MTHVFLLWSMWLSATMAGWNLSSTWLFLVQGYESYEIKIQTGLNLE